MQLRPWLALSKSKTCEWSRSVCVTGVLADGHAALSPQLWPSKHFPEHSKESILSLLTAMEILHPLTESGMSDVEEADARRTFVVPCMLPGKLALLRLACTGLHTHTIQRTSLSI